MAGRCEICGKYSGFYPLCKTCFSLRDEGKIEQCPDCKTWHYIEEPCNCEEEEDDELPIERQPQPNEKCIVCEEDAPKGPLCRDCYYEMLDLKDSFDRNQQAFQLKDYYFNLRNNIFRMKNFDYIQSNSLKLMALAVLTKDLHNDESLTDRVVNDIKDLIEKKKPQEDTEKNITHSKIFTEYSKIQDSQKEEIKRTKDGHYVKSDPEALIDDILYEQRIVHCYEKKVPINIDEQAMYADWFIPILNNRQGIYIEYWGMKTREYLANKERKLTTYKAHNIPLISIEKDDYKDQQGLTDRLIIEINTLAEKFFGIKNFIK